VRAVEKDHLLAFEFDRDRGNCAHRPRADAFGTKFIDLARIGEDAEVELGSFFGVVLEPEEWRKFVHGWDCSSEETLSGRRDCYGSA